VLDLAAGSHRFVVRLCCPVDLFAAPIENVLGDISDWCNPHLPKCGLSESLHGRFYHS
jgi:hypothetical protein